MIEALAAFKAVKLANNLGLTEVEFEGDASALKDPAKNLSLWKYHFGYTERI